MLTKGKVPFPRHVLQLLDTSKPAAYDQSSGLFLCDKALGCVLLLRIGFSSVTLSARSPQTIIKSKENPEIGVLVLGWRLKIQCRLFPKRSSSGVSSAGLMGRAVSCGGLMTAKSFPEGQQGKSGWGRGTGGAPLQSCYVASSNGVSHCGD